ncbi:cell division protein FtsB [Neptuniibacter pectenicola]|jgi:cell division protein FtsB|uniref:Cell division protein FtsB n=1 Tax=Neptuniibacter pectenicola TaxID=1806669 RepID=A0ABU9TQX1_9GAMM|nr:cell division protein FtsB [Neptuniibacter pectenicola]KXJ55012.1 MAG: cell division protein FtsB [Neptuniibacter sp. Phe_28]|tara:strand:- start:4004 stop:4294 length:291 start_codon:yes stop_codon:yes gene_type:complete
MYRWFIALLIFLLLGLQYRLWFGEVNVRDIWDLNAKIELQKSINQELSQRNSELEAEVVDLKKGQAALEERARSELGMVRDGETFFQLVEPADENR